MSTVVAQPYNTVGNGGRKLVRLSNGNLIAVVKNVSDTSFYVYISVNNGLTWGLLYASTYSATGMGDVAAVANGTNIILISKANNTVLRAYVIDGITGVSTYVQLDGNQTEIDNVSLAIDPTNGHLHAAWASKNTSSPSVFHIRYAKSTDGGVTWSVAVRVGAPSNTSGYNYSNPSIVITNGKPVILIHAKESTSYRIYAFVFSDTSNSWAPKTVYYGDVYEQSSPSAVVDKNGVIHVVWQSKISASSADDRLGYSKSIDGGITWTPMLNLTAKLKTMLGSAFIGVYGGSLTVDKNNKLVVIFAANVNSQILLYRLSNTDGVWEQDAIKLFSTQGHKSAPSTLYDPNLEISDTPPTVYQSFNVNGFQTSVEYIGAYKTNDEPNLTLSTPTANQTLYENDTFNITGTALDINNGNSITVRYQINATTARAIKAFLSDGTTLESFSKTLTFKGGSLYDGDTLIASNLSDGIAHTLKVWATDDQGGTSAIREIPFYVVPNRAPLLTVNVPVISGLINSDKFTIEGTFEDSDGNNTIVSYRLNGASSVQDAEGVNGSFEFELSFGQLVIGANEIVIEAVDSYGAKVSKTVKLNKAAVETPLLKSTARYKINPPTGSASGVLLWIQRDENLDIDVSISMTMQGEAESFIPLTVSNSAPLDQNSPIIEDEFYHEADGTKDNIILQIDMERASLEVTDKIYLISGVLD